MNLSYLELDDRALEQEKLNRVNNSYFDLDSIDAPDNCKYVYRNLEVSDLTVNCILQFHDIPPCPTTMTTTAKFAVVFWCANHMEMGDYFANLASNFGVHGVNSDKPVDDATLERNRVRSKWLQRVRVHFTLKKRLFTIVITETDSGKPRLILKRRGLNERTSI